MNEPNQTLYVANIDWKIKKPVLKRSLHTLFNRHGKILDIIALRKDGLRGQAFILFEDVQSATSALKAEQGFTFFGKDLQLQYAKEKSDRIAKQDGTFVPKDRKRQAADEISTSDKKLKIDAAPTEADDADVDVTVSVPVPVPVPVSNTVEVHDPASLVKDVETDDEADGAAVATPSNILFADSLPKDCNEMMLACLFRSYAGYKEVRIPREGLAFIEFDEEPHASVALKALNGFKLSADDTLKLNYGKS